MSPGLRRCAILALLALLGSIYFPLLGSGFLLYEDPTYVAANPMVQGGLGLRGIAWAATTFHAAVWLPLTWISHMADWSLFGNRPGLHHLMNVGLHGLSSVLLYVWLRRATGRTGLALAAAAVFALHPLRVESVAWVSCRKDVLSAVFLFSTLLVWHSWVERPSVGRYVGALALYSLGLASKSTLVPLPLALLALDIWPYRRLSRGRIAGRVVEKLGFVPFAAGASLMTSLAARHGGAVASLVASPFHARVENAFASVAAYLFDFVWPSGLAPYYPFTPVLPAWIWGGAFVLCACITLLAWRLRERAPWIAAGWTWFLVMLVPTLGIVQVGTQSRADRFTYVPMVGLTWAVVWTVDGAARKAATRHAARIAAIAACVALAVASALQVRFWQDDVRLFRHTLAVTGENPFAALNLANALIVQAGASAPVAPDEAGRQLAESEALYRRAAEGRPYFAEAHFNLATLLMETGRLPEAVSEYRAAVRARPGDARLRNDLGVALARSGDTAEAAVQFEEAVRLDPTYEDARRNLSMARAASR